MRSLVPLFAMALAASAPGARDGERSRFRHFRSVQLRGGGDGHAPSPAGAAGHDRRGQHQRSRASASSATANCGSTPATAIARANIDLRVEIQSPHVPDVAIAGGGLIRALGGFRRAARSCRWRSAAAARSTARRRSRQRLRRGPRRRANLASAPRHSLSAAVNGGGEVRYSRQSRRSSSAIHGGGAVHRTAMRARRPRPGRRRT